MKIKLSLLVLLLFTFAMNAQPVLPTLPPGRMLNYWRFDDTNWPGLFGASPRSAVNVELTDGVDGNAARFAGLFAAHLPYNLVEPTGRTNLNLQNGSVRFWFRPDFDSGTGPGSYARLLDVGAHTTDGSYGWWSLYLDPAGTNLFFSAQAGGQGSNFLAASVQWSAWEWHQIALTYSPSNSTLYVDGSPVAEGTGVTLTPSGAVQLATGFALGSDATGGNLAQGSFDELKTYNYPVSAAQVERFYADESTLYGLGGLFSMNFSLSLPGFGEGGGGGGGEENFAASVPAYFGLSGSTNLWIEILPPTNNVSVLRLHNTQGGTNYQLLARSTVGTNTPWSIMQDVPGAAGTNVTVTTARTDLLPLQFLAFGVSEDTDGDGLPDAWELLVSHTSMTNADTGNTGIPDGYKDPDGDGWTNLDEMRNGTNPLVFNTPVPPANLHVQVISGGTQLRLTWDSAQGSVAGYVIRRSGSQIATVGPNTLSVDITNTGAADAQFTLSATYSNGVSVDSSAVSPYFSSGLAATSYLLRGSAGSRYLAVDARPASVVEVELQNPYASVQIAIPVEAFSNGVAHITNSLITNANSVFFQGNYVQLVETNGLAGVPYSSTCQSLVEFNWTGQAELQPDLSPPFTDWQRVILDNAKFALRAGTKKQQFAFSMWNASQSARARVPVSAEYEISEFHTRQAAESVRIDILRPLKDSFLWRNFCFESNAFNSFGNFDTGIIYVNPFVILSPKYDYDASSQQSQLAASNSRWVYFAGIFSGSVQQTNIGINNFTMSGTNGWVVGSVTNVHGMPLRSILLSRKPALDDPIRRNFVRYPGETIAIANYTAFFDFEEPQLQTVSYFFSSLTDGRNSQMFTSLVPNNYGFSSTNQTPLIVASVGRPSYISGWVKKRIVNGNQSKFAYLEQFFDKAYRADASGNATTNQTGVLSEYGEFFPTEAGLTILKTKPDIETGEVGECRVSVMKIGLDVDRDGLVDLTYGGPDNTSAARPLRFWRNNDYDRGHVVDSTDFEEDDLKPGADGFPQSSVPDWQYTDPVSYMPVIPCKRDLEDYAPIHFAGVSELITNLPSGYTVELHWRNPSTAPGINIFRATAPDGTATYLTDTNAANAQIGTNGFYVGSVSSFQTINLTQKFAENATNTARRLNDHFIFCGSANGSGELVLQVKDSNGTVITEASAFLEISDIKNLYERWTVGEVFSPGSSYSLGPLPAWQRENALPPAVSDEEKDYILLVHGWNMSPWEKERWAETAFKRLYWQGYKGRFGLFKWPTYFQTGHLFQDVVFDAANFDRSEFNAWKSATPLNSLLNYLQGQYPDRVRLLAHSMGNVVAGESLKLAGASTLVQTYVASQAAIPAHCYDPNTAFNMAFESILGPITPNAYAAYWTNGSPQFFSGIQGAAKFVNYFNPRDWALTTNYWELNQKTKPDFGYSYDTAGGFARGGTPLFFPTNTYEIFSFADESRSVALGRQTNVGGVFTVAAQVNLDAKFAFADKHKGHSAQFRSYNALRGSYWNQLLLTYGLKEAQ